MNGGGLIGSAGALFTAWRTDGAMAFQVVKTASGNSWRMRADFFIRAAREYQRDAARGCAAAQNYAHGEPVRRHAVEIDHDGRGIFRLDAADQTGGVERRGIHFEARSTQEGSAFAGEILLPTDEPHQGHGDMVAGAIQMKSPAATGYQESPKR